VLFFLAAAIIWLLAQSLTLGGKIGWESLAYAGLYGGFFGFWSVLWIAFSDWLSRAMAPRIVAPMVYLALALGGFAAAWSWLAFNRVRPSNDDVLFSQHWALVIGGPLALIVLIYLGRNISKSLLRS
jgi:hypothetical protein